MTGILALVMKQKDGRGRVLPRLHCQHPSGSGQSGADAAPRKQCHDAGCRVCSVPLHDRGVYGNSIVHDLSATSCEGCVNCTSCYRDNPTKSSESHRPSTRTFPWASILASRHNRARIFLKTISFLKGSSQLTLALSNGHACPTSWTFCNHSATAAESAPPAESQSGFLGRTGTTSHVATALQFKDVIPHRIALFALETRSFDGMIVFSTTTALGT